MIEIQPFHPQHARAVASLVLDIQRDEFGFEITLDDQPDLKDVPTHYLRGSGGFWVATAREQVAGCIGLLDFAPGEGALRKMFVASGWRGGEIGVAARLLNVLLDHARERALKHVWLGTTERFLAAHRFYEKQGFTSVDAAALPAAFPRMPVDTRFYVRAP